MQTKAYILSLAAIALWGTLAFLALELSSMPPFLLVGMALIIGSLCSIRQITRWRVPLRTLLLGIYGVFGFHFCLFMALRLAPPLEANLINYLWPLLIVVMAPVFLPGYRLHTRHIIASLMGFAGAILIVTGGSFSFRKEYVTGYGLAGASAFIWASYSLLTKRVAMFPNAAIGLFCLAAGILSLTMHVWIEPAYFLTVRDVLILFVLGIGPMGAAFYLWDAALKKGDPRVIGSLAYLTPMLSTLILAATGRGTLTVYSGLAMALIIGGAIAGSPVIRRGGYRHISREICR